MGVRGRVVVGEKKKEISMFRFICLLLALALHPCAVAQSPSGIYVEYYLLSNPNDGWAAVPGFPNRHGTPVEPGLSSGSSITINNMSNAPHRVFAVSPSTTDIGSITLGSSSVTTQLMIGAGFTQVTSLSQLPTAGARHIGDITSNVQRLSLQARVTGTMSGTISAYKIVRLDANDISADISHNPGADTTAPSLDWIQVANSVSGTITSYKGDIGTVRVAVGGSSGLLSGSVVASTGSITTINVGGNITGDILAGTSANPGSISTVTAAGNITGLISAPYGAIGTVTAGGTIGTSTSLSTIEGGVAPNVPPTAVPPRSVPPRPEVRQPAASPSTSTFDHFEPLP